MRYEDSFATPPVPREGAIVTEEEALWQAVGTNPADSLPRLVLADWMDENDRPETAAALRATADRVPYPNSPGQHREYWWCESGDGYYPVNGIPTDVFRRLTGAITFGDLRDYSTAEAAIRDLCAAWVKVHKVEGGK